MKIAIATDIFGYTPYISELAEQLSCLTPEVEVINPYGASKPLPTLESEAYTLFKSECGHNKYMEMVNTLLLSDTSQI